MNQQPLITLVDQIFAADKKQPPLSPFNRGEGDADTVALERRIDKMVYDLYGLAPKEIEIAERKK